MRLRARTALALLSLFAALAATRAGAGDLVFGIGANTFYDDNVYGTSRDETDDFSIQFVPKARYIDRVGTLGIDIRYDPLYELFVDESRLRGWDHSARAAFEWRPSATTAVTLEDDLARYRNARLLTTTDASGTPIEGGSREPLFRNVLRAGVVHDATPTSRISASAEFGLWDFTESNRFDQESYSGALEYLALVRRDLRLGASLSISHAAFDDAPGRSNSDTTYYAVYAALEWQPTDRLSFEASVGPAYVDQRKERVTPPPGAVLLAPIPEIDPASNTTAFANVGLRWALSRGELSLSYQRRDDFGSALGFSAVTDSVTARGRYQFLRNLSGDLALIWEGRQGELEFVAFQTVVPPFVLPVRVASTQELDSVSASLLVTYYVTETTKLALSTFWRSQDDRSDVISRFNDLERLQVALWFTHQFAAIRW